MNGVAKRWLLAVVCIDFSLYISSLTVIQRLMNWLIDLNSKVNLESMNEWIKLKNKLHRWIWV